MTHLVTLCKVQNAAPKFAVSQGIHHIVLPLRSSVQKPGGPRRRFEIPTGLSSRPSSRRPGTFWRPELQLLCTASKASTARASSATLCFV